MRDSDQSELAQREVLPIEMLSLLILLALLPLNLDSSGEEVSREIASLSVRLHAALVRSGLNRAR